MLTGCGGGKTSVSGMVTYTDDGSPVTAGTVVFDDGVKQARGKIKPDGKYVMGFDKETNGVPSGEYGVTVMDAFELVPVPEGVYVYPIPVKELIEEKYKNKNTSGLTITVGKSKQVYDIKVDRSTAAPAPMQIHKLQGQE